MALVKVGEEQRVRVLVTGATGFVGQHLCQLILDQPGWTVDAVARRPIGSEHQRYRAHRLDLTDAATVTALLASIRPEAIIHLAAQASVARSYSEPAATLIDNQLAQLNLLEGCQVTGLDPVIIIASSSEVYGASARRGLALTESAPLQPVSPYAVSKVAQEMLGLQYFLSHGRRIVRLRLFNHIGPGQRPEFALASFARQIVLAEQGLQAPVLRVGNLAARRDFLDVRDVARAYLLAVQHGRPGAVYNVGSDQAHGVGELLNHLVQGARLPLTIEVDMARWRPLDLPLIVADSRLFRAVTGWQPLITLEQTITDLLNDWRGRLPHEVGA